ncbi:Catabolic 3-dehydroquinase [Cytospora mali]|uniref:Catabolic 3-dehydroquinase n=1 Tax=Cytospora mali TaxID=578113 RepID=A0A194W2L1_CYTMA|nr:Catabolic 3-dehydroquinase [Valsa mali]
MAYIRINRKVMNGNGDPLTRKIMKEGKEGIGYYEYVTAYTMPRRILLINGPNLNLLGTREPHIYGSTTLSDVTASAQSQAQSLGITLETFQSNHEGAVVDRIQEAAGFSSSADGGSQGQSGKQDGNRKEKVSAIIINPGAYTHTSVAIRDALLGVEIPFVEVHVSNVHAREPFRKHSYLSDKAVAVVAGLGVYGYQVALEFAARHMKLKDEE